MSQVLKLQHLAVNATKKQDWQTALQFNQQLLELKPLDINALNRLGATYLQLKKSAKAKQIFKQVLEIDRSNKLANKHLKRIKNKQNTNLPAFSNEYFIEEPGKTKSVELYRLADKNVLTKISIGKECHLQPKNRYISVCLDDVYIGSLPEDLSFRLTKLIKSGNTYSCRIRSCDRALCVVHLREVKRSKKNQNTNSFPANQIGVNTTINEVDESMLEDDIPVEIVHTDTDIEITFDDIQTLDD
ncbi:tetratricopeptide repeat protein [Patescibacteria group bacterium]|nr:tetratricopeptide repeat protein [Patescibacteria group bacterium]MBU1967052.1 tetratricopeptide repeat protein [Patescibacteria group bacterium]MBU2542998.1 tetratricopeptide repeat protein [Patescibacteria group bacterium]